MARCNSHSQSSVAWAATNATQNTNIGAIPPRSNIRAPVSSGVNRSRRSVVSLSSDHRTVWGLAHQRRVNR